MFKPGDVVTDLDPESMYFGKQGEVLSVQNCFWEPPEVLVRFARELYMGYLEKDECIFGVSSIYRPDELRLDEDWEPEAYAQRIFGGNWHHVRTLKASLDKSEPCMVEGCPCNQKEVSWVNIWGTVINVYVCEDHARYFKKYSCMDAFPHRKSKQSA